MKIVPVFADDDEDINLFLLDRRKIKKLKRKYYHVMCFMDNASYTIMSYNNEDVLFYDCYSDINEYGNGICVIKKYKNVDKSLIKNGVIFIDMYVMFKTKSDYMKWKLKSE